MLRTLDVGFPAGLTHVMPGLKRIRIKKVSRVALLAEGANLTRGLYKAAGATELTITPLAKSAVTDEGSMYQIVYAPDFVDAHGHFMGKEDIKQSLYSYAQEGLPLDLHHGKDVLPKSKVFIAEQMLLTGTDPRFPQVDTTGRTIPHEGAWGAVIHFPDLELRKKAKDGELGEVSLYAAAGDFTLEDVAESDLPSVLQKSSKDNDDMKPEDLKAALEANNAALAKTLGDTLTAALAPLTKTSTPPATPSTPEPAKTVPFDPTDPAHLAKMALQAGMNDVYEEFGIDPTNAEADIKLLKSAELARYTEAVQDLRKELGLSKGPGRAGRTGPTRFAERDNVPQDGTFEDWNKNFGQLPLTKQRWERERAKA